LQTSPLASSGRTGDFWVITVVDTPIQKTIVAGKQLDVKHDAFSYIIYYI